MIVSLILAAGMGKRMGQLKQTLPWGEGILLEQVIKVHHQAGVTPISVVVGHEAQEIKARLSHLDVIWIDNPAYREGMGSSLRAGIKGLPRETTGVLLSLGDLPLIKPDTLRQIMEIHRSKQAEIIIPVYQGKKGHPVFLGKGFFSQLLTVQGDMGARQIIKNNEDQVHYLNVKDKGIIQDIDDLDTYTRLKREKEGCPHADHD